PADGCRPSARSRRAPGSHARRRAGMVPARSAASRQLPEGGGMTGALPERDAAMEPVDYDPFAGGELARVVASTEPQREIWLADQLGSDASLSFNLSVSLRLHGRLDRGALLRALQCLVDRHESLRASFDPQGERLCIRKPLPFTVVETDLCALRGDALREAVEARVRHSVEIGRAHV